MRDAYAACKNTTQTMCGSTHSRSSKLPGHARWNISLRVTQLAICDWPKNTHAPNRTSENGPTTCVTHPWDLSSSPSPDLFGMSAPPPLFYKFPFRTCIRAEAIEHLALRRRAPTPSKHKTTRCTLEQTLSERQEVHALYKHAHKLVELCCFGFATHLTFV